MREQKVEGAEAAGAGAGAAAAGAAAAAAAAAAADKCCCFDRRWPQRPAVLREVSEVLHSERVAGV